MYVCTGCGRVVEFRPGEYHILLRVYDGRDGRKVPVSTCCGAWVPVDNLDGLFDALEGAERVVR